MNLPRVTPFKSVTIQGKGLFTATPVTCTIDPNPLGDGIYFLRSDLPNAPRVQAHSNQICDTPVHPAFANLPPRSTNLKEQSSTIYTVEHILSALVGMGYTDAIIKLNAPELPIDDGSSAIFTNALKQASTTALPSFIEPLIITKPLTIETDQQCTIQALPSQIPLTPSTAPTCNYEYLLDFGPDAPIAPQSASWSTINRNYASTVARARTFCLDHEAQAMAQLGLFKDLSPQDMLVISATGPVQNSYRFDNEPARHKLLDLIGDLALIARPIHGNIIATRSGHAMNHAMARALLENFA